MVSPNTRARLLQEARDHQEREGDAAAEIAEKRERMKIFEEQVQKQAAILRQLDVNEATVTHEVGRVSPRFSICDADHGVTNSSATWIAKSGGCMSLFRSAVNGKAEVLYSTRESGSRKP